MKFTEAEGPVASILAAIADAKSNDPFARVDVVVPFGARRLALELGRARALANVVVLNSDNLVNSASDHRVVRVEVPDAISTEGVRIVSCPDVHVEARIALREVINARRSGMPWSSMAIVAPTHHARSELQSVFTNAGISFASRQGLPLAQSAAGRFVLLLADVVKQNYSRASLANLWANVPLVNPLTGHGVPIETWERDSRKRNAVVTGDDWHRSKNDELIAFVESLRVHMSSGSLSSSLISAIATYLPRVDSPMWNAIFRERSRAESEAVDAVMRIVGSTDPSNLGDLSNLGEALSAQRMEGTGRIGIGVQIDVPEALAFGQFELVIVTGMVDSVIPRRGESRQVRIGALAQLLANPNATRIVTVPRVDTARRREAHVAAPLLTALSNELQRPIDSETVHSQLDRVEKVASFHAVLGELPIITEADALLDALRQGDIDKIDVAAMADLPPRIRASALATTSRRSTEWTPYDGRLANGFDPTINTWSVTSLESFHACPLKIFLRDGLNARPLDQPESATEPTPSSIGQVVHGVLETLARQWLEEPMTSRPDWPEWLGSRSEADLDAAYDSTVDRLCEVGMVRPGPWWDAQLRWIRARLSGYLRSEANDSSGFSPVAVEEGSDSEHPFIVTFGTDSLRLIGRVDRIDVGTQGSTSTLRVIDYKTGKIAKFGRIEPDDPIVGGTIMQLPLYGAMYMARHNVTFDKVEGRYLNPLRAKPSDRVVPIDLTEAIGLATDAVAAAGERMRAGQFQFHADPANCRYCDVAAACPVDRERLETQKLEVGK